MEILFSPTGSKINLPSITTDADGFFEVSLKPLGVSKQCEPAIPAELTSKEEEEERTRDDAQAPTSSLRLFEDRQVMDFTEQLTAFWSGWNWLLMRSRLSQKFNSAASTPR